MPDEQPIREIDRHRGVHSEGVGKAKSALREEVLRRRDSLGTRERVVRSTSITAALIELDAYRQARVVMAYCSFGTEFGTGEFNDHVLSEGKALILPRMNRAKKELELYRVSDPSRDLEAGLWGILEPNPDRCSPVALTDVEFVLVPGVAFDRQCRRLGYGAGFYDRLLGPAHSRPPLVVAAFETQIVHCVPAVAHDVPMDLVITEDARYERISRARDRER